jgi:hypothetical protein
MKTLDLHMIRHSQAGDKVREFLNFVDLPARIVTGKSSQMRGIVSFVVKEYEYDFHLESAHNVGAMIVCEKGYSF